MAANYNADFNLIKDLQSWTAAGPDQITSRILRLDAEGNARIFYWFVQLSTQTMQGSVWSENSQFDSCI